MSATPQSVLLAISLLVCLGAILYFSRPPGRYPEERRRKRRRAGWAMLLGALYGLGMRVMLGLAGHLPLLSSVLPRPVSISFLVLMPMAVGAIAVYCGDEEERRSLGYQVAAPALDIFIFLGLTALSFLEGSICIVLAAPVFLLMAVAGGLLMGLVLRLSGAGRGVARCMVALPLLMAPLENAVGSREQVREIKLHTTIHAAPALVWANIKNARDIRPEELGSSWVYAIGVPRPEEGLTEVTPQGEVRWSRWSHGVRFRENILAQIPGRTVLWDFHFDERSVPPGVLDEHVRIGGRYFDLVDTRYDIEPLGGGDCALSLTAHYRVSTGFNAYAALWADAMLRSAGGTVLHFYKYRSETDQVRLHAVAAAPGG